MRFRLKTSVHGTVQEVYQQFGPELLLKLTPPMMKVEILEMAYPVRLGSLVRIEVTIMGLIKQNWKNEITDLNKGEKECFFVDEGLELPGMFSKWRHNHIIRTGKDGLTEIVDDVSYESGNALLTWLIYPAVYLQFVWRKPVYRRFFREKFLENKER